MRGGVTTFATSQRTRIRIGNTHPDRLITYPDRHNLSRSRALLRRHQRTAPPLPPTGRPCRLTPAASTTRAIRSHFCRLTWHSAPHKARSYALTHATSARAPKHPASVSSTAPDTKLIGSPGKAYAGGCCYKRRQSAAFSTRLRPRMLQTSSICGRKRQKKPIWGSD